jgi:hypothetical protein
MLTLEEVTYQAGRSALADQEAFVAGIRQRTGTLLAGQALVASFLGSSVVRTDGLDIYAWLAVVLLVLGLAASAILLGTWRLRFAIDARALYSELVRQASAEVVDERLGWLAEAGFGYQALRECNRAKVRKMSQISSAIGALMVTQTLAWLVALAVN